jgi:NAD(P)-dependent dehydrogenase (short-subunit alcohol dehydrogenase family)
MDLTVLITGSTAGVGRYVTERLAAQGAHVLAHGRDQAKLDQLGKEVPGSITTYRADLSSLDEVHDLAQRVRQEHQSLDVLINNAGVGSGEPKQGRQLSKDGNELRFAVNYLAPVLLTRGLLPVITGRVINEGSLGMDEIDFDDLTMEHRYNGTLAYCRSKLALAAWTFDLADENDGILANCIHPATFMDTEMVRNAGVTPWSTVADGGDAVLRLVTEETGTGLFFDGVNRAKAHPAAYDEQTRQRLRKATDGLLSRFS